MANLHTAHTNLLRHAGPDIGQRTERGHPVGFVHVYVFSLDEVHALQRENNG